MTELKGSDRYQRPSLWYIDACIELGELDVAEDYLDQCLVIARERTTLFLPSLRRCWRVFGIGSDILRTRLGRLPRWPSANPEKMGTATRQAALELWLMTSSRVTQYCKRVVPTFAE